MDFQSRVDGAVFSMSFCKGNKSNAYGYVLEEYADLLCDLCGSIPGSVDHIADYGPKDLGMGYYHDVMVLK